MERHEEYAEQFLWAAGMTLALAGSVLILRRPGAVRLLTAASVAGTVAVAAAGIRVGHAGGQLVYVHNAGSAYGSGVEAARAPSAVPSADRVHDDR
jgi:hypothetical protein